VVGIGIQCQLRGKESGGRSPKTQAKKFTADQKLFTVRVIGGDKGDGIRRKRDCGFIDRVVSVSLPVNLDFIVRVLMNRRCMIALIVEMLDRNE
jgi:hypothetical protein